MILAEYQAKNTFAGKIIYKNNTSSQPSSYELFNLLLKFIQKNHDRHCISSNTFKYFQISSNIFKQWKYFCLIKLQNLTHIKDLIKVPYLKL